MVNFIREKVKNYLHLNYSIKLNISNNIHIVSSSYGADVAFEIAIARPDLIQSIIFVARYGLINVQHSVGPIGRLILKSTSIQYMLKFGLTHFLPFKNSYFNKDIARNDATRESYLKPIRDGRIFFKSLILLTQNYDPSSRAGQNTRSTRTRNEKINLIVINTFIGFTTTSLALGRNFYLLVVLLNV
ncbi:unnamed protein product [Rotaria magnacalcarata]|uniref:Uncharacterized protein n=1 Tax=Rotaria magnacalcarata TaxID=392030 RepID=A0A815T8G9_9BILA|nr:unnamed protein product [Rotaria magnacalcarata]